MSNRLKNPPGLLEAVARLPRVFKRGIMVGADVVMIPATLFVALSLRLGVLDHFQRTGIWPYVFVLGGTIPVFVFLGLYRAVVRYIGGKAIRNVCVGVSFSALILCAVNSFARGRAIPMGAIPTFWAFAFIYVAGSRAIVRYIFLYYGVRVGRRERVAIYGAGDAGARLSSLLQAGSAFEPVAFLDDKRTLHRNHINGLTVYPPSDLPELVKEKSIQRILLAMPAASRRRRREILQSFDCEGVRIQSLPELSDLISGRARIDDLLDVDVNDLLGRDPVPPNPELFRGCIEGKTVMVTGAGGSIGSELCRQIITLSPRRLVLFEMSEVALYTIDQELQKAAVKNGLQIEILPLLGNAHHRQRVREVMQSCGVQTVYHAAAYKHVPIVEHNMIEGLHNNIVSTWHTAEAALDVGVETFVLISTDKAVNPANVMGATKRFAELVLQGLQSRSNTTRFCMVRFGNVLDSSGSVVPLFREQIRQGGPVTVTHVDVIRYFMTIPEAAQLVIQAGSMGRGGDVFVLDMGDPVRIDDLARRMIALMGLSVRDIANPDGDIEIKYTGLRTAEKLYEELLIGSNVEGTAHPRIMRAIEHSLPWERVQQLLDDLLVALANFDCRRAAARLMDAVAEYEMKGEIQDVVWQRKLMMLPKGDSKVSVIPRRTTGSSPYGRGQGEGPV